MNHAALRMALILSSVAVAGPVAACEMSRQSVQWIQSQPPEVHLMQMLRSDSGLPWRVLIGRLDERGPTDFVVTPLHVFKGDVPTPMPLQYSMSCGDPFRIGGIYLIFATPTSSRFTSDRDLYLANPLGGVFALTPDEVRALIHRVASDPSLHPPRR